MPQDAGPGRLWSVNTIKIGDWVMGGHPDTGDWGPWLIVTKLPADTDPPNVVFLMRPVGDASAPPERFAFGPSEKLLRLREA